MPRQSISVTDPNSEWLRVKVELEDEYASNSEVVNDLIRKARASEQAEINAIRAALRAGEESGISDKSPDDIIKAVLKRKDKTA
ncbi:hypothetical protein O4H49_03820 [Kiloniella laminariae]|uniref:Addiction module antitoxin n=1 Tax=Kiloniella laminariae TaxID=454162 RepID=A0ABT4LFL0_9PROT|nr:hypothetical protein [Kiloniella laminariae]MCZ4279891.1 hypothetical protein [Kiloniella laminariae]